MVTVQTKDIFQKSKNCILENLIIEFLQYDCSNIMKANKMEHINLWIITKKLIFQSTGEIKILEA